MVQQCSVHKLKTDECMQILKTGCLHSKKMTNNMYEVIYVPETVLPVLARTWLGQQILYNTEA